MKSMRDFDYFSEGAKPATAEELAKLGELPEAVEVQLARYRGQRRRALLQASGAALATLAWTAFLWSSADEIVYAFRSRGLPPLEMGDVATLTPADIPHNEYVRVEGITEHRGLKQQRVRGFALSRRELWYFRLLGSSGVFIETPPDPARYSIATSLTVTGRAVDPAADGSYDGMLGEYHSRWTAAERPVLRIIQVGVLPGDGRGAWLFAIGFDALLTAFTAFLVRRWRRLCASTPG